MSRAAFPALCFAKTVSGKENSKKLLDTARIFLGLDSYVL